MGMALIDHDKISVGAVTAVDILSTLPICKAKIINLGPGILHLGNSAISITTGYPLGVLGEIDWDRQPNEKLYAICETGLTADVRILIKQRGGLNNV